MTKREPPPILLAEDEESDVFLFRMAYEKAAIPNPLVVVPDGRELIHYIGGEPPYDDRAAYPFPGLVLLDLKMPVVTGFQALAWIKSRQDVANVPVVVLTSSQHETDIEMARQLGAREFVVKSGKQQETVAMLRDLYLHWLAAPPEARPPRGFVRPAYLL